MFSVKCNAALNLQINKNGFITFDARFAKCTGKHSRLAATGFNRNIKAAILRFQLRFN